LTVLLHDLLRDAAKRAPQSIAIQDKVSSLTYQALDNRVTQASNTLTANGVKRGARIGVLLSKSSQAYIGLYAVLRAGCAYVPLDKRAPVDRLSFFIRDCSIDTLVITSDLYTKAVELQKKAPELNRLLIIDDTQKEVMAGLETLDTDDIGAQTETPIQPFQIIDTDLAYILYTSGSTGQPKGVMINHHTSMSFVRWSAEEAGLTDSDRVSGHAPLHFDLSIFDIYATALAGATLFPVSDGASTFPARLINWMTGNKISVWYSVPSILSMMAQQKNFSGQTFPDLRLLIFAGEVFPVPYLKIWRKQIPDKTMMNWFGPTETNVITSYTVPENIDSLEKPIPIGKTTTNADLIRINEDGDIVENAEDPGEIIARGACVALGYWGDEVKTAQKFFYNGYSPWLKDHMYRTGDIVTIDENGDYIFLGRNDHLIKSRGFRIELGEVEAAFYRQENIKESVVIPIDDDLIGKKLYAFVVIDVPSDKSSDEERGDKKEIYAIQKAISELLPYYMIPGEIRLLDELPKTSNGKIDRLKLASNLENNA